MKNFSLSLHSTGLSKTPEIILGSYMMLYDRPKNVTFGHFFRQNSILWDDH